LNEGAVSAWSLNGPFGGSSGSRFPTRCREPESHRPWSGLPERQIADRQIVDRENQPKALRSHDALYKANSLILRGLAYQVNLLRTPPERLARKMKTALSRAHRFGSATLGNTLGILSISLSRGKVCAVPLRYSSRSTSSGRSPRIRKLANQPVAVASTEVPKRATSVATHSN